jgi:GNAT superfamily N-acetyltransferase
VTVVVRAALAADAPELMRLRGVMLASMTGTAVEPGEWYQTGLEILRRRLGSDLAAYVVDGSASSLAACAVGTIEERLGDPRNPSGRHGYVFNMCTDPRYRRRGLARACLAALLDWYRSRGITRIDLHATGDGEPLYTELGFARAEVPLMRLRMADPRG